MLKGIPEILSPELLMVLCEMGHGDTLADGHGVPELLDAILKLIPLDTYIEKPVKLMEVMPGDPTPTPEIWGTYEEIVKKYDERGTDCIGTVERFNFYDIAREAYCIIATGEKAIYANVLLQKGVVKNG